MNYHHFEEDPVYIRVKSHSCPYCYGELQYEKLHKIVNTRDKNFSWYRQRFECYDLMWGEVTFSWMEFYCPTCDQYHRVNEIREHEGLEPYVYGRKNRRKAMSFSRKLVLFLIGILLIIGIVFLKEYLGN